MEEEKTTSLLFIYEPEQIELALDYIKKIDQEKKPVIVALDYEVEMDLKAKGIPYCSLQEYWHAPESSRELLERGRRLGREWYHSPELNFFMYRGIRLGESLELAVSFYFERVLYYLDAIHKVLEAYSGENVELVVLESTEIIAPTAGPTAKFEVRVPLDVVCLFGEARNIPVKVISVSHTSSHWVIPFFRHWRNLLAHFIFKLINQYLRITRSAQTIKLFAVDTWGHIGPFVEKMDNVELVMLERREAGKAGIAIWRKKIRFHHRHDFLSREMQKNAMKVQGDFAQQWRAVSEMPSFAQSFWHRQIFFWPIAQKVFDSLLTNFSGEMVKDIESIAALFTHYRISIVLLRASSNGLLCFAAQVARIFRIPSLELQHALEDPEPTSISSQIKSDFLACYGRLAKERMQKAGNSPHVFIEVGSPSFDRYRLRRISEIDTKELCERLGLDLSRPILLYVVPAVLMTLEHPNFDTYQVVERLQSIGKLAAMVPDMQIIFKLRAWGYRKRFFYNAIKELDLPSYAITQYDDLQLLLAVSNVVVSGNSTAVVEAMLMDKPVVLFGIKDIDTHFTPFLTSGSVLHARNGKELMDDVKKLLFDPILSKGMVAKANKFVEENFLIDGEAAQRLVKFLDSFSLK